MNRQRLAVLGCILLSATACSPKSPAPSGGGASSQAAAPVAVPHVLSCDSPVARDATAESLVATYPGEAVVGSIMGPEGSEAHGVILYGNDPTRRIEVTFWDNGKVSDVSLGAAATAWTGPSGLRLGSGLADVEAANGKPFQLFGFGWDYGGYVNDLKGGKLAHLPGGCSLSVRLATPEGAHVPDSLSGEKPLSSDDAAVKALGAKVETMSIGWAPPPGQSDTE